MTPDFTERAVWSGKQWSRAKTEVKWSESQSVVSSSLRLHGLYSLWNSPGQKTGVGSLSLLQGILTTQGSNPGLLRCRQILYHLSHKGSPRILEWGAYPFSKGFSRPRNGTRVSCIAGGFFASWAMKGALSIANDLLLWDILPSVRPQRTRLETYVFAIFFSNFGKYCYPHLQMR